MDSYFFFFKSIGLKSILTTVNTGLRQWTRPPSSSHSNPVCSSGTGASTWNVSSHELWNHERKKFPQCLSTSTYLFIERIAFVDAISVLKKGKHHVLCLSGTTGWIFLLPGWKIFSTSHHGWIFFLLRREGRVGNNRILGCIYRKN